MLTAAAILAVVALVGVAITVALLEWGIGAVFDARRERERTKAGLDISNLN